MCDDVVNPANDKACTEYLSTCRLFKGKCINSNVCGSYTYTSSLTLQDC